METFNTKIKNGHILCNHEARFVIFYLECSSQENHETNFNAKFFLNSAWHICVVNLRSLLLMPIIHLDYNFPLGLQSKTASRMHAINSCGGSAN